MDAVPPVVIEEDEVNCCLSIHDFVHAVQLLDASVRPALRHRIERLDLNAAITGA